MTILTGPVNSTANTFSASDDSLLLPNGLPQMLQIESEKFLIRGFEAVGSHNTRWYVDRGVDGSSAASHSGGTAITVVSSGAGGGGVSVTDGTTTVAATSLQIPLGTLTDAGAGVAKVGLLWQIIGPFHLTYNRANIHDAAGVLWQAMPTGSWFFVGGVRTTADWSGSPDQAIYLGPSDGVYGVALKAYTNVNAIGTTEGPGVVWTTAFGGGAPAEGWFYPTGGQLRIRMDDISATTGAADIFAIIAVPAS